MTGIRNVVILLLLLLSAAAGHAQQPPSPGDVQRSLDRGVSPPVVRDEAPATERPEAPQKPVVTAGGKRFKVNRFRFRGNTVYSDEQLRDRIKDAEGQLLTLAEIYAVADRLTDYYHAAGLSLALVTVPAQKVSQGEVLLEVVEGRIGAVRVQGETSYTTGFLTGRMHNLDPGTPLTFGNLERELLLLDDLPGLTVRSVIEPGTDYGTSDLVLKTAERRLEGRLGVDNFGRESIGEWRASATAAVNNPFGIGDQLTGGVTHTESGLLTSGNLGYNVAVGDRGGRLSLLASRAEYTVDGVPIDGTSITYRAGYTLPLIRSRQRNLVVEVGISHAEPEQQGLAAGPIDADLTLLDVGLSYSALHPDRSQSTAQARLATNFTSANELANTKLDDGQALRIELSATHERPIAKGWSLFGRLTAVYSPDELNDLQKFSIGGPASVRSYLVTEISGDSGADASLELRHFFLPHRRIPAVARLFVDGGTVKCKGGVPCIGGGDTASRTGWGVGLTLFPFERYTVEVQWARSLDAHRAADGDEESRFWISLAADLK